MLHMISVTLLLVVMQAEATMIWHWTREHYLVGTQQAAVGTGFQFSYRGRD